MQHLALQIVDHIEKNCAGIEFDDVVFYKWIDDSIEKAIDIDGHAVEINKTKPILVSFYISGTKDRLHRIFIGSEECDNNINVSTAMFATKLFEFLQELEDSRLPSLMAIDGGDDGRYKFKNTSELSDYLKNR